MDNVVTEGEAQRNCLDIRNNIPNSDRVRILEEVDLSTPISTAQSQYASSRKSATPGSVTRQLAGATMFAGATQLNTCGTPSSTSQSQSERNSSEKTASDIDALALRTRGAGVVDFSSDYNTNEEVAVNKVVLEPRARERQSTKQRLFDVPLNDDGSSGDDFPVQNTTAKRSGKRNRSRNGASLNESKASQKGATHDASNADSNANALPSLEDGLSSASPVESTEDELDTDERTANGGLSASTKQRRVRTKKRSTGKQRAAHGHAQPQAQTTDTLLNLNLVQEINDEIDSLKRTFLYETAQATRKSAEPAEHAACSIPPLPPPPSAADSGLERERERERTPSTNGTAKLIDTDTPVRGQPDVAELNAAPSENDSASPATVTLNAFAKNDAARCSDSVSARLDSSAFDRHAFDCADLGQSLLHAAAPGPADSGPLPIDISTGPLLPLEPIPEHERHSEPESDRLARFFSFDQSNTQSVAARLPSLDESPSHIDKRHRLGRSRSTAERPTLERMRARAVDSEDIPQSQSMRFNPFNAEPEAAHESTGHPPAAYPADMNVLPCYMYCTHCGTVSVHHLIPAYGAAQPGAPAAHPPTAIVNGLNAQTRVLDDSAGHPPPARHVHGANCTCQHAHQPSACTKTNGSRPKTLNTARSPLQIEQPPSGSDEGSMQAHTDALTITARRPQQLNETTGDESATSAPRAPPKGAERKSRDVYRKDYDSDEEEEGLMDKQYKRQEENRLDIPELRETKQVQDEKRKKKIREVYVRHPENPEVLLEGVLFRSRYLGSTQLISDTHTTKYTRMLQAQSALQQIKAPDGESQPSVEVELFVSAEKLLILNTNLKEILMDHPLRTVSFIADIGDVVVIMARRRLIAPGGEDGQALGSPGSSDEILPGSRNGPGRRSPGGLSRSASGDSTASRSSASDTGSMRRQIDVPKMQAKVVCHVIECDDAQLVAQSIGQAFQVAYVEFLKANGIDEPQAQSDVDYQDVLNSQEIFNEELRLFTSSEYQKDVLIPKAKGEPLGVVIVESGWGSVIPTVVLANMDPRGAAARCGQLNIGDQIMSINGISFVGLPLATCQNHIKNVRAQTSVKLAVISCPPVVEVLIKRPDPKYQLGFSVQNGVICSLLRGGIAERGGVRVGHRIIEINSQSVVAVPHDKIVQMLSAAVGEIHMRTMPTTIFRLLTGQDTPHYI